MRRGIATRKSDGLRPEFRASRWREGMGFVIAAYLLVFLAASCGPQCEERRELCRAALSTAPGQGPCDINEAILDDCEEKLEQCGDTYCYAALDVSCPDRAFVQCPE